MMARDSARAFYGPAHVRAAHELGAVQTLMLTDTLLRVNNVAERRRYAKLVDEVKEGGGEAIIFSGESRNSQYHNPCNMYQTPSRWTKNSREW